MMAGTFKVHSTIYRKCDKFEERLTETEELIYVS